MPSETFQRADLDLLLSVRVDVAQVPGGASQRQILDSIRTFLGSLKRDDSTDGRALDPDLGFARPYYAGGFTVGVVPVSGRGKVALAGAMREHRLLVQAGSACHRRVRWAGAL